MGISILFDIGGTKMRVAVGSEELEEAKTVQTPKNPDEAFSVLAGLSKDVSAGREITRAVGCIRGVIVDGVYWKDKILSDWEGLHLVNRISRTLGVPTRVLNDCAVIGLGEAHHGGGRGSKICGYITISTGVNGARIDYGEIDHYTYGFEIGRQIVDGEHLEDLVSGTAVRKKYGVEPKDLASLEEREKLADILAVGLYNTYVHWSPDTFVLGGSMMIGVNPIPLERVGEALFALLGDYPQLPALKLAELGDLGGLHGAFVLAQST